jgi:hypothetical protein
LDVSSGGITKTSFFKLCKLEGGNQEGEGDVGVEEGEEEEVRAAALFLWYFRCKYSGNAEEGTAESAKRGREGGVSRSVRGGTQQLRCNDNGNAEEDEHEERVLVATATGRVKLLQLK